MFKIKTEQEIATLTSSSDTEKRGFVEVPLDYADPSQPGLQIFYRFIAAQESTVNDKTKPILVVVNGGPGLPSSLYRSYDYDYSVPFEEMVEDRLKNLTRWFRVLIMDHRGTSGNSTALELDSKDIDYAYIAKHFGADSIARDQERVINEVLGEEQPFYMLAQSFGGMVGSQYLMQPEIRRKPQAMIFSCSLMPFENACERTYSRRQAQKELNQQLKKFFPDIKLRVAELKRHFSQFGIDPNHCNVLWELLGHGVDGDWQHEFIDKMDSLMTMDKESIQQYISESIGTPNLLNYILSPANNNGMTDTKLARMAMEEIPFEPWMFDECATFIAATKGDSTQAQIIRRVDRCPPPALDFGLPEDVKHALNAVPLEFMFGKNDAYTPTELSIEHMLTHFYMKGKTAFETFDAGHQAAFTEKGALFIHNWTKQIMSPKLQRTMFWDKKDGATFSEEAVHGEACSSTLT